MSDKVSVASVAQPVSVDVRQPPANTYVLARYVGGNWHDADDQAGCVWKVVKFMHSIDASGDNQRPYQWREFGPGIWFGQDFDLWCDIPRGRT